jgi:hypothetical protein
VTTFDHLISDEHYSCRCYVVEAAADAGICWWSCCGAVVLK